MKKIFKAALVAITLFTSSMAFAEVKIGIVDVREVLQKAPQMAKISADIKKQFKPRQAKIVAAEKDLQEKIAKLKRDGSVMTEDQRAQLKNKIIADKATLDGMMASFEQDITDAKNKAMQNFMNQLNTVITKLGADGKYTVIVVRDAAAYFDKALDITPQVIQQLGKK